MAKPITVRLSEAERNLIDKCAAEEGSAISAYVRSAALDRARGVLHQPVLSDAEELIQMADTLLDDLEKMRAEGMGSLELLRASQSLEKLVQVRDRAVAIVTKERSMVQASAVQEFLQGAIGAVGQWLSVSLERDLASYGVRPATVPDVRTGIMAAPEQAFGDAFN